MNEQKCFLLVYGDDWISPFALPSFCSVRALDMPFFKECTYNSVGDTRYIGEAHYYALWKMHLWSILFD